MARAKATGIFLVTPVQFDEDSAVQGLQFPSASKATDYATKMVKTSRRLYAKIMGLDKDEAKELTSAIGLDILMQQTDAKGKPTGDAFVYDTVGLVDVDDDEDEDDE